MVDTREQRPNPFTPPPKLAPGWIRKPPVQSRREWIERIRKEIPK